MNEPQLKDLLDDLDAAKVECDAMSRLVVTRLAKQHIPYRAMLGQVELDGKVVSPHFWVETCEWRKTCRWIKGPLSPSGCMPIGVVIWSPCLAIMSNWTWPSPIRGAGAEARGGGAAGSGANPCRLRGFERSRHGRSAGDPELPPLC